MELADDVPSEVEVFRVGDRVTEADPGGGPRPEEFFLERLKRLHVLIINWDAVNGDPEFGADTTLRWFEVHGPQVMRWVEKQGGVLIIEGQATFSVPSQRAYDALTAPGELLVSGREDPWTLAPARVGVKCRVPRHARRSEVFRDLHVIDAVEARRFEDYFPPPANRALDPELRGAKWTKVMYRGWFQWRGISKSRLAWVSVIRTDDRGIWVRPYRGFRNYDVLRLARHGRGVIYASTMYLASTGQRRLLTAMLRAEIADLPHPRRLSLILRQRIFNHVLPVGAGVASALIVRDAAWTKDIAKGALMILVPGIFWTLSLIARGLRHFRRVVTGA